MIAKKHCVLGICPGTTTIGLAVMLEGELVEWRVKTFTERWSSDKRLTILDTVKRLCEYHSVTMVTIKKVDPLRSSLILDKLIMSLIKQAKRSHIMVRQLSLADLDYDIHTGRKQKKSDISDNVAMRHPEIRQEYSKERNSNKEYYTKMFEAIAIAEHSWE